MKSGNKKKVSIGSKFGIVAVFLLAAAGGYVASPILLPNISSREKVYPEPVLTLVNRPSPDESGKYSFRVNSDWTGTESVSFLLYARQDTISPLMVAATGDFDGVEPVDGGTYYVRVAVPELGLQSKLYSVKGFDVILDEQADEEMVLDIENIQLRVESVRSFGNNVYNLSVSSSDTLQRSMADKYQFVLYKSSDARDFRQTGLVSSIGLFSSVSVERGMKYYVRLEMSDDESVSSAYFQIEELVWNEPKPTMECLSAQEVQDLINRKQSLMKDVHFSSTAKISISNVNETSKNWKTLHNFIQQKFVWSSVVVDSVRYTPANKVDMVYITVIYE